MQQFRYLDRFVEQALGAERSMLTTSGPEELKALDKTRTDNIGQADDRWKQYKALPLSQQEAKAIAAYDAACVEWGKLSDQVPTLIKEGSAASLQMARAISISTGTDKFGPMRGQIEESDQPACPERDHRGRSGGRVRQGVRRGVRGSPQTGRQRGRDFRGGRRVH